MSTLKIRLDVRDLYDGPSEFGVVANIHPVPSKERKAPLTREERETLQNILIPAGNLWDPDPRFYWATLPPGRYFIEAVLPSEEVVGEEVLVLDSPEPQELRLVADESPHEWMSWQRFSGNVAAAKQYARGFERAAKGVVPVLDTILLATVSPPVDEPLSLDQDGEAAWLAQGFLFANPELQASAREDQITTFPGWSAMNPPARMSTSLQVYSSDPLYKIYTLDLDRISTLLGPPTQGGAYQQERFDRYFLLTQGPGFPSQVSALPVPWGLADFSGEATVEALVYRGGAAEGELDGMDQGFRNSIVVQERIFGSLIGYLGAGRLPAADTVLKHARGMLFGKMENPLAAAAGAYVLVSNPDPDRPDYWHDWVRNLMRRFPWLPDGAILYGRLLLGKGRDEDTMREARACFLEGFRRGLPFFSKGVVYLQDGLTRFANDARRRAEPDRPVAAAQAVIQDLALRTNVRQPFTCYLLD